MKPFIGISTGEVVNKSEPWAPVVYGQSKTYSDVILAAGGIPVLIPFMPEDDLHEVYSRLDGLLMAGGNDIDPALYGEERNPRTQDVSPARDTAEKSLITWALDDNKPVLAICRGFQMLNVVMGGSLYQDIPSERPGSSDHDLSTLKEDRAYLAHVLTVATDSRLGTIIESSRLATNTHHHQGIKKTAPGLTEAAWAEDGLVEAVEDPAKSFILGVQSHPESLFGSDEKWLRVFRSFVDASDNYRASLPANALSSSSTL